MRNPACTLELAKILGHVGQTRTFESDSGRMKVAKIWQGYVRRSQWISVQRTTMDSIRIPGRCIKKKINVLERNSRTHGISILGKSFTYRPSRNWQGQWQERGICMYVTGWRIKRILERTLVKLEFRPDDDLPISRWSRFFSTQK